MKEVLIKGTVSYRYLIDFDNYTRKEEIIKKMLLPFALIINSALFLIAVLFLGLEYCFSYIVKLFIVLQAKIIHKKMNLVEERRKWLTLLSVLLGFIFLPFIALYYLFMLLKTLFKSLMRTLIVVLDFANNIEHQSIQLLDDSGMTVNQPVMQLFKGLYQTQALGDAIETYFEAMNDNDQNNFVN